MAGFKSAFSLLKLGIELVPQWGIVWHDLLSIILLKFSDFLDIVFNYIQCCILYAYIFMNIRACLHNMYTRLLFI